MRALPNAVALKMGNVNAWIAARVGTTRRRIFQIEIGGLLALGFTAMQIGEWAAAVTI
jgi:hypothetical protein